MRDGVKRCREVQEDEDAEAARVSSNEEIVILMRAVSVLCCCLKPDWKGS